MAIYIFDKLVPRRNTALQQRVYASFHDIYNAESNNSQLSVPLLKFQYWFSKRRALGRRHRQPRDLPNARGLFRGLATWVRLLTAGKSSCFRRLDIKPLLFQTGECTFAFYLLYEVDVGQFDDLFPFEMFYALISCVYGRSNFSWLHLSTDSINFYLTEFRKTYLFMSRNPKLKSFLNGNVIVNHREFYLRTCRDAF